MTAQNQFRSQWGLDPKVTFLNHGSFGACPKAVLQTQQKLRDQMEAQPVQFFLRDLEGLLTQSRMKLSQFLGADPNGLVFVNNATTGVNSVIRSIDLRQGDELLTTNHDYKACRNALEYAASHAGAKIVVADISLPISSPQQVVDSILRQVTPRTRIALLDHVTSPTGLVFPIQELVFELRKRGVESLVDGAHAPGMLQLDLVSLGADYYIGNCHKWLCAPKGAAFLYVKNEHWSRIRPLALSHGASVEMPHRFQMEFDWTGTQDCTAALSIPAAIQHMNGLVPGGWPEIIRRNRELALSARTVLSEILGVPSICPDEMIGSLATIPLPDKVDTLKIGPFATHPLQDQLLKEFGIEVPIFIWPKSPKRMLRVSAQLYNDMEEYKRLGEAVLKLIS